MRPDDGRGRKRPAPFWEHADGAGDPSLIMLEAPQARSFSDMAPTMPEDAKHRALLRAGLRSQAESLLMASLGRRRETTTGRAVPQGDELDPPAADRLVAEALTQANDVFGVEDRTAVAEVRGGLQALLSQIRQHGLERREELRRDAAFGALETEADDLVERVRQDPDRYDSYVSLLATAVDRFSEGLDPEARDAFVENVGRELDGARVRGLIDQGRVADAREALANVRDGLSDEIVLGFERDIAAAERARARSDIAERALLVGSLQAQIASGGDVAGQIATAVEAGRLTPPDRRQLQRAQDAWQKQETLVSEAVARVGEAIDHGRSLDHAASDDRFAVNVFWARELGPRLDKLEPFKRIDIEAQLMASLGVVPSTIMSRMAEALTIGPAPAAVVAAGQVVETVSLRPEMVDAYPGPLLELADRIWQAHLGGAQPDLAVAYGRRLLPTREEEPGKPDPDPSQTPELVTTLGTRTYTLSRSGPPGIPLYSQAALGTAALRTVAQAPGSGNIANKPDVLPDAPGTMYLRRMSGLSERLDPRYPDEYGHAERRQIQDATVEAFTESPGLLWDLAGTLWDYIRQQR